MRVQQWAEFMELGRDEPDARLDEIIASQKPNQCCTLIYTSGTTGQPKGVMLSHDNVSYCLHPEVSHVWRLTQNTLTVATSGNKPFQLRSFQSKLSPCEGNV